MDWKAVIGKDTVKIKANADDCNYWSESVKGKTLCKLKSTDNGYIAKFPSHASTYQDYYVCLDPAQASDLLKALVMQSKQLLDDEEREFLIGMLNMDQVG